MRYPYDGRVLFATMTLLPFTAGCLFVALSRATFNIASKGFLFRLAARACRAGSLRSEQSLFVSRRLQLSTNRIAFYKFQQGGPGI